MVGSAVGQKYGSESSDILTVGFPGLLPLFLLLELLSNTTHFQHELLIKVLTLSTLTVRINCF